jgi:tRNA (cytidine32/uridine32-2'-O)-methyltransferase
LKKNAPHGAAPGHFSSAALILRDEPIHRIHPAPADEMERFFDHLFETLHAIDFHKGRSAKTIEQRLRRLFHRAMPDARELRILHGVLADAERMASLAKGRS